MKSWRVPVVLLLALLLPLTASAGVRMQVAMDAAAMQPAHHHHAAASGAGPACAHMAGGAQKGTPPCCAGKSGRDCKICTLPAPVAPRAALFAPLSATQFVLAAREPAVHSEGISGLWRPPRPL